MTTDIDALDVDRPYASKTFAEVLDDYVLVRGDLSAKYAREQLVSEHEARLRDLLDERDRMLATDFATLMGEHAATGSDERKIDGEWMWGFDCECGEFVPDTACNEHLADAIRAALRAALAGEDA